MTRKLSRLKLLQRSLAVQSDVVSSFAALGTEAR